MPVRTARGSVRLSPSPRFHTLHHVRLPTRSPLPVLPTPNPRPCAMQPIMDTSPSTPHRTIVEPSPDDSRGGPLAARVPKMLGRSVASALPDSTEYGWIAGQHDQTGAAVARKELHWAGQGQRGHNKARIAIGGPEWPVRVDRMGTPVSNGRFWRPEAAVDGTTLAG